MPLNGPKPVPEVAEALALSFSSAVLPYLYEMATEHVMKPGYDFGAEFSVGLKLILDSLTILLGTPER